MPTIMTITLNGADASWTQQALLQQLSPSAGDGSVDSSFGVAALDADGDTLLLSTPGAESNAGRVIYWSRSGSTWTQEQEIAPTGSSPRGFGSSVALSDDGLTAVIGEREYDDAFTNQGRLQIFTRSGSTWTHLQSFEGSEASEQMGAWCGITAAGDRIITGGGDSFDDINVYRDDAGTWVLEQAISTGITTNEADISGDGTTIVVAGSSGSDGIAQVYTRSGTTWSKQGSDLTDDMVGTFGARLPSIATDGDRIAVGSPFGSAPGEVATNTGYVVTWTRSGSTWTHDETFGPDTPSSNDSFLFTKMSGDGSRIVFSGPTGAPFTGEVQVFEDNAGTFTYVTDLVRTPAPSAGALYYFITMSRDGKYIAISAPSDDLNATDAGSVTIFSI